MATDWWLRPSRMMRREAGNLMATVQDDTYELGIVLLDLILIGLSPADRRRILACRGAWMQLMKEAAVGMLQRNEDIQ
jgi:hypothetical protein